jgi:uncharacterized protein (TIGR02246 family)
VDGDVTGAEAAAVVARHLDAVRGGDPAAMAADYAADAVIVRAGARITGRDAILAYFSGLPARLAGGRVEFGPLRRDGDRVAFSWRITGGPGDGTSGTDTCRVRGGEIVEQVVALDSEDF